MENLETGHHILHVQRHVEVEFSIVKESVITQHHQMVVEIVLVMHVKVEVAQISHAKVRDHKKFVLLPECFIL